MSERDPNEIGALWEKQGRKGVYMTGKIGDQPVVIFRNDRKPEGSKAPDWRVLKPVKQDRDQDQRVPTTVTDLADQDVPF